MEHVRESTGHTGRMRKPPSWAGHVSPGSVVRRAVGGSGAGGPATHLAAPPLALSADQSSPGPPPQGALVGPSCSLAGSVAVPSIARGGPWVSTDFLSPVSLWSAIGKGQKGVGCNDHLFFKEFCYIQRKSNLMTGMLTVSNKNHVENVSRPVILKHGSSPQ